MGKRPGKESIASIKSPDSGETHSAWARLSNTDRYYALFMEEPCIIEKGLGTDKLPTEFVMYFHEIEKESSESGFTEEYDHCEVVHR